MSSQLVRAPRAVCGLKPLGCVFCRVLSKTQAGVRVPVLWLAGSGRSLRQCLCDVLGCCCAHALAVADSSSMVSLELNAGTPPSKAGPLYISACRGESEMSSPFVGWPLPHPRPEVGSQVGRLSRSSSQPCQSCAQHAPLNPLSGEQGGSQLGFPTTHAAHIAGAFSHGISSAAQSRRAPHGGPRAGPLGALRPRRPVLVDPHSDSGAGGVVGRLAS